LTDSQNTYKAAGVDVEAGDAASHLAFEAAQRTFRPEVFVQNGVTLFDAASLSRYQEPLLLGGSDGVGTKLKVAFAANRHNTVGIDLVAMSVNDLARRGAEPLLFLPYFATSKLDPAIAAQVAEGVSEGCVRANCSIVGGETAEIPGFYAEGEYDLAGSAFGIVERSRLITGETIQADDIVLGLASSGLHSNGYSLARRVLLQHLQLEDTPAEFKGQSVADVLLEPTRIYVKAVLAAQAAQATIHGLAHITGGGLNRKLGKIIPAGLEAKLDNTSWQIPPVFQLIQQLGQVKQAEMFDTFNMGIGFAAVVPASDAQAVQTIFEQAGETVWTIGKIV
jgi:phosphoribosylformylglycinamidine cyclo-ligase